MELKDRLKEAMERAEGGPVKAIQLAADTKLSRSAISLILSGTTKSLTATNATALSKRLNVRTEWLVDGKGPMRPCGEGKSSAGQEPKSVGKLGLRIDKKPGKHQEQFICLVQLLASNLKDDDARALSLLFARCIGHSLDALILESARHEAKKS